MRTISVQVMPNGFEVEKPTFFDWMKVGMAFTLGGIVATVTAWVVWLVLTLAMASAVFSHWAR